VVIVTEVNNPPVLPVQTDRTIEVLTALTVTNTATDSDLPANTLSYLLITPPAGAAISSQGIITWTPTVGQGNTTNILTTVVNDGTASVTNSFHVFVNAVVVPNITGFSVNSGIATITWNSTSGRNYRLQYKNDLNAASWTDVTPDVPATGSSTTTTDSIVGSSKRWYRVMLVP
jgi:hypothetical protein